MELEECIKDGFDDSLREFIQSEEYRTQKQQEQFLLEELQRGFSDTQKRQFNRFLDAATESNSMLLSEAYLHGVVEGIALRNKVILAIGICVMILTTFFWKQFADLKTRKLWYQKLLLQLLMI